MMLRGIVTTIVLTAALLPAASAPATAATKPPPPKVGACYSYTYKQSAAASSPTRAVSCAGRHTAVTYFVGTVTGTPARSTSPTSSAVVAQEARACQLRWVSLMGSRIVMSRASYTFFTPTAAQWKAGARWFRCDGVVNALNALVTIPANFLAFARSTAGITAYKRCLTSTHLVTACSATHTLMVKTYVVLGTATARFPGASALLTRGSALCNAASPTTPVVWVTYPLAVGWAAGMRTGDCYVAG